MHHLLNIAKYFLLVIFAILIFSVLSVVGFCWTIIKLFYKTKIKNALEGLSKYFFTIALSINQIGAVVFKGLFNDALIKGEGLPFGDEDKQISEVLGWNERYFELTKSGKLLVRILDKLDPKHCQKTLFKEVEKSERKFELFKYLENERTRSV